MVSTSISYLGTPLTLSQTSQHDRNHRFQSDVKHGWRGRVFVLGLPESCVGWFVGVRNTKGKWRSLPVSCTFPFAPALLFSAPSYDTPLSPPSLYLTFLIHCTSFCLSFALTFFSPGPRGFIFLLPSVPVTTLTILPMCTSLRSTIELLLISAGRTVRVKSR